MANKTVVDQVGNRYYAQKQEDRMTSGVVALSKTSDMQEFVMPTQLFDSLMKPVRTRRGASDIATGAAHNLPEGG